jgi:hypothetical protein
LTRFGSVVFMIRSLVDYYLCFCLTLFGVCSFKDMSSFALTILFSLVFCSHLTLHGLRQFFIHCLFFSDFSFISHLFKLFGHLVSVIKSGYAKAKNQFIKTKLIFRWSLYCPDLKNGLLFQVASVADMNKRAIFQRCAVGIISFTWRVRDLFYNFLCLCGIHNLNFN